MLPMQTLTANWRARLPRPRLGSVMLLAAIGGVMTGVLLPSFALQIGWLSDVFLRLVRMLIAPLLFGVLVPAIGNAAAAGQVGRLGWYSLVVFEIATTVALLLGWAVAIVSGIGTGIHLPADSTPAAPPTSIQEVVLNVVPVSIVDAMARGDVLQIVVFCLLFGLAALAVGARARPVIDLAESIAVITLRCTALVMWLAPLAVFAALAATVAAHGARLLQGLGQFVVAAWIAEIAFLVLLAAALAASRIPVARFATYVREPFLIGLATSSSAAALPQTFIGLERFGVPERVRSFVTPLSLTLHMNGAAVYLGLATMFVAQAAGASLSWSSQLVMLLTLKVASKGATGIPRATVVILAAVSEQFGLPASGVTLLLGVDALVDPIRTAVNVTSHCAAPVLVQQWERASPSRPGEA